MIIDISICFECGDKAEEMHHIVPKLLGGTKTIPLCSKCHGMAHGFLNREGHKKLTIEGLKRAKERGVILGSPKNLTYEAKLKGVDSVKKKALTNTNNLKAIEIINTYKESDATLKEIANFLNENGFKTSKNCLFRPATVLRIKRLYENNIS